MASLSIYLNTRYVSDTFTIHGKMYFILEFQKFKAMEFDYTEINKIFESILEREGFKPAI